MSREMVVLVFASRALLTKALDRMTQLDYVDFRRAAIVARAANGETIVLDDDVSPDQGAIAGGTLGAALSLLGVAQLGALALPGVGAIIALGAAVVVGGMLGRLTGRWAANFIEFGFRPEQIEGLAAQIHKDYAALVIELIDADSILARLRDDLRPYHYELIQPERVRTP
jgi:hypothetical protein